MVFGWSETSSIFFEILSSILLEGEAVVFFSIFHHCDCFLLWSNVGVTNVTSLILRDAHVQCSSSSCMLQLDKALALANVTIVTSGRKK